MTPSLAETPARARCPRCDGKGEIAVAMSSRKGAYHAARCPDCSGTGLAPMTEEMLRVVEEVVDLRRAFPLEPARPEIICLCGSSRFIHEFAVFAWELEKGGKIVLGLHLLPDSYAQGIADHIAEAQGVAAQMDELHLRKIDLADRVIVLNIGGYIGDSTRREIAHALAHGKPVSYLEPETR